MQIDNIRRISSDVERLQETETSNMEEPADTEETPHPVVRRAAAAGHHGVRDGPVQVVGATRRIRPRHPVRAVSHIGASADTGLQTRVSRNPDDSFLKIRIPNL